MNLRSLVTALLAVWLAFGPVASAWAQSADKPCESMHMSTPADDCCGDDMNQAKCVSACLSVLPALAVGALRLDPAVSAANAVANPSVRHASILAPPDASPPKTFVS